uniref:Putative secreted protein n=1 Tax=Panstrongylus lignarius TaxID=156445 RepID=A0A224XTU2_9HEMI
MATCPGKERGSAPLFSFALLFITIIESIFSCVDCFLLPVFVPFPFFFLESHGSSESLSSSKGLKSLLILLSSEWNSLSPDSESDNLNSEPELEPISESLDESARTLFTARAAA